MDVNRNINVTWTGQNGPLLGTLEKDCLDQTQKLAEMVHQMINRICF